MFDGATFEPALDQARLTRQHARVLACMSDHAWRSLDDIARATGDPPASVSARLRDLRKARFGGYLVERRRVAGGLFHYRVLPPPGDPLQPTLAWW